MFWVIHKLFDAAAKLVVWRLILLLLLLFWVIHKLSDAAAELKSTSSLEIDIIVVLGHTQTCLMQVQN